jgi:ATP adenylyltransferase
VGDRAPYGEAVAARCRGATVPGHFAIIRENERRGYYDGNCSNVGQDFSAFEEHNMALTTCSFCAKLQRNGLPDAANPWDHHVFTTAECVAMPTKGAMVPGWLLVSPRRHFLSIGAMDAPMLAEFSEFVKVVVSAVEDTFGPSVLFEHGPACGGNAVGCGVDHAHLHVVPTNFDLLQELNSIFPENLVWADANGLTATRDAASRGLSYLFFHSSATGSVIATHPAFKSQLFRRALASCLGRSNRFDWRDDPEIPNVDLTLSALGHWKSRSVSLRVSTV